MAKHRAFRLAETVKEEVSRIIREDLKDPRIGFVTVTSVEVADDLRYARVYVSIMGNEEETKVTLDVLQKAAGYVRSELGKVLRIRYSPEVVFKYDQSIKHGAHISKLLHDVGANSNNDGSGESNDE